MQIESALRQFRQERRQVLVPVGALALLLALLLFESARQTAHFVIWNLLEVAPLVVPGIVVAGWVSASGAGGMIAGRLKGGQLAMIVVASAAGAVTPVCGVTVLPLMATLLASGIPLAPVMAFWLSSPITDPAMLAATAAMLGVGFAVAKTVAAFALGILGGIATWLAGSRDWTMRPLRDNAIVGRLDMAGTCETGEFQPFIWRQPESLTRFRSEMTGMTRLIMICLVPAFAAEYLLHALLDPGSLSGLVGEDSLWAVPLAVFVGAPIYLEGYAALPLARGLIDHGMSQGAALAFLVSGGVVSVWGAVAIVPVLRIQPFALYLAVAVAGSLLVGWAYGAIA